MENCSALAVDWDVLFMDKIYAKHEYNNHSLRIHVHMTMLKNIKYKWIAMHFAQDEFISNTILQHGSEQSIIETMGTLIKLTQFQFIF